MGADLMTHLLVGDKAMDNFEGQNRMATCATGGTPIGG